MSQAPAGRIRVLHVDDEPGFAEMAAEFLTSVTTNGSTSRRRRASARPWTGYARTGCTASSLTTTCRVGTASNSSRPFARTSRTSPSSTVGELPDGLFVEDDGPGIPADERVRVFDSGYTTKAGGTGFGLNVVGRIVEAHD